MATAMNFTLSSKRVCIIANDLQSRSRHLVIFEVFVFALFVVLCTLGNMTVIWVVFKKRHQKNMTYLLIGSLALSDFLLPPCIGWQSTVVLVQGKWSLGWFVCQFQGYSVASLTSVSILTMNVMAINRFLKVVKPKYYKLLFKHNRTKVIIVCIWAIGGLGAPLLYVVTRNTFKFHSGKLLCFLNLEKTFTIIFGYTYVGTSIIIIIICYILIFKKIKHHQKLIKRLNNRPTNLGGPSIEDIKATQTLFVTMVGFLICWIPIYIIDMVDLARGYLSMSREVYTVYTYLGNISGTLNPTIYGALNRAFRTEYRKIWRCCIKRGRAAVKPVSNQRLHGSPCIAAAGPAIIQCSPKLINAKTPPIRVQVRPSEVSPEKEA